MAHHWTALSRNQKAVLFGFYFLLWEIAVTLYYGCANLPTKSVLLAQGWYWNRGCWRRDHKDFAVVQGTMPQPDKYPPAISIGIRRRRCLPKWLRRLGTKPDKKG